MNVCESCKSWGARRFEAYYLTSSFSLLFMLLTMVFVLFFGQAIGMMVKHYAQLPLDARWSFGLLLVLIPLPWLRAYVQHRRIRRLVAEVEPANRVLLGEVASSSFGLVLFAYLILLFSLNVIGKLVKQLA